MTALPPGREMDARFPIQGGLTVSRAAAERAFGVYVRHYALHAKDNPALATDVDALVGWFAGAIMAGYDHRRVTPPPNDREAAQ